MNQEKDQSVIPAKVMNESPYHFNFEEEEHICPAHGNFIDSTLVVIFRMLYFLLCPAAYMSALIFDSLPVGRTLAFVAGSFAAVDCISTIVLLVLGRLNGQRKNYQPISKQNQ